MGVSELLQVDLKESLKFIRLMVEEWSEVEHRIAATTKGAGDQKQLLSALFDIAQRTRTAYGATADLFGELSLADINTSQSDTLKLSENVNKALILGGKSVKDNQVAAAQFAQILRSGIVKGDGLKSLIDAAPKLAHAVADGMGVTLAELEDLSNSGQLTSEQVVQAVLSQTDRLNQEFLAMPPTIGQSLAVANNLIGQFFADLEKETGIFSTIAEGIIGAMKWLNNEVRYVIKELGGFENAARLAGVAAEGLSAGFAYYKIASFADGIKNVGDLLTKLSINPAFLRGALLAGGAVALIGLAISEVYNWINGGESVLGNWLGSWENFSAKAESIFAPFLDGLQRLGAAIEETFLPVLTMLANLTMWLFGVVGKTIGALVETVVDELMAIYGDGEWIFNSLLAIWNGVIDSIILGLKFWRQIFTGDFEGAIQTVEQIFNKLLSTALTVIQNIGMAIANYLLPKLGILGQGISWLMGIDLSKATGPNGAAIAGGSNSIFNQGVTVNMTVPPGTPAEQRIQLKDSAALSFSETYKLGNGLRYSYMP